MAKDIRIREIFPDYPRSKNGIPGWDSLPIVWVERDLRESAHKIIAKSCDWQEARETFITETRLAANRLAMILSDAKRGVEKSVEVLALGMARGAVLNELEYSRRWNVAKEALKKAVGGIVEGEYRDVIDVDTRKPLLQRLLETIDAELDYKKER
jgi:hypothetical protein